MLFTNQGLVKEHCPGINLRSDNHKPASTWEASSEELIRRSSITAALDAISPISLPKATNQKARLTQFFPISIAYIAAKTAAATGPRQDLLFSRSHRAMTKSLGGTFLIRPSCIATLAMGERSSVLLAFCSLFYFLLFLARLRNALSPMFGLCRPGWFLHILNHYRRHRKKKRLPYLKILIICFNCKTP